MKKENKKTIKQKKGFYSYRADESIYIAARKKAMDENKTLSFKIEELLTHYISK